MNAVHEAEALPLSLSLSLQDSMVLALLTDWRAVQQFASQPLDAGVFQSIGGGLIDESAARQAFAALVPAPIAQRLGKSRSCPLTLQMPPALDALNWERLSDGVQRLGDKFALVRQLADGSTTDSAAAADEAHAELDVRVLDAGQSEQHLVQSLPDVVWLRSEAPPGALFARWQQLHGRLPRLIAVSCRKTGSVASWHDVTRRGSALAVLDAHAADELFDGLCDALRAGCSVAEAARRTRVAAGAGAGLRVYGPAFEPLVLPPLARSELDGLRQVTVLSFDLVDSTGLLARLGDERYSQLLEQYHARCAAVVRLHGGVADDPQGDDGVMGYFGFPQAQEDSAQRAVRAGLELPAAVADLDLRLRVGIATGRVAIHGGQPVGLVVHVAARLQAQAQPGDVVIAEATQKLVAAHFEIATIGVGIALKGIQGVHSLHRVARALKPGAQRWRQLTRFVGRLDELAALQQQWERARGGAGATVVLRGEPGIGKSRLLRELRHALRADGHDVLSCVGRPEWSRSPFEALADSLRRYLQIGPRDSQATLLRKIEARMPGALRASDGQAALLIASLLSTTDPAAARQPGAEGRRQHTLDVMLAWFVATAAAKPFALVIDDAHWVDPSTREFIERLLAKTASVPLLVLLATRPDTDGAWLPTTPHVQMELRGLPLQAAWEMVRHAGGHNTLPDNVVRLLASRADGVPLYLEESAHMAAEMGVGAPDAPAALQLHVSSKIEDVLMARIDRLGPAKAVAQLGAVLGREFPAALLTAVLDLAGGGLHIEQAGRQLDALLASGLLTQTVSERGAAYRFKHALVCDVAYQSLWERDRRAIHEAAATVIARRFPSLAEQTPEVLAHHLTQAGKLDQALQAWEGAARRAAAHSANLEALAHAQQALAVLQRLALSPARDRAELRLQGFLASRLIATEGYGAQQVEQAYLRAAQLADALGDEAAQAKITLGLEAYYFMRADFAQARELAQRAAAEARAAPDPMHRLQTRWALANIDYHEGHLHKAIEGMDQCLAIYRPEFHRPGAVQDPGVMCLCYSAWAYWESGNASEAARRIQRVIELAQTLAHRFSQGEAFGFAASVHLFRREHEIALAHAERAIAICEEDGYTVWLAHARLMRGQALAQLGRVEQGIAEMDRGYALWVGTGAQVTRPFYRSLQAEGELLAGRPDQAAALLDDALQTAELHGEHYHRAELLRLRGQALAAAAPEQARLCFEQALDCAERQGKTAFVLRSALSLARLCGAEHAARLRAALMAAPQAQDSGDAMQARRWLAQHDSAAVTEERPQA